MYKDPMSTNISIQLFLKVGYHIPNMFIEFLSIFRAGILHQKRRCQFFYLYFNQSFLGMSLSSLLSK